MLNSHRNDFVDTVTAASRRLGTTNAPKIADEVIRLAFPRTSKEAEREGALSMLRVGVINEVKRLVRSFSTEGETQVDFADINASFAPLVRPLRSKSYFVESIGEYVRVPELIDTPEYLDEARKFMRKKGDECIAEADRLDKLYNAVLEAVRC